jgi:hypothetical protein
MLCWLFPRSLFDMRDGLSPFLGSINHVPFTLQRVEQH